MYKINFKVLKLMRIVFLENSKFVTALFGFYVYRVIHLKVDLFVQTDNSCVMIPSRQTWNVHVARNPHAPD